MAKGEQRYVLVSDDDGHWFVCPANRTADFSKWVEAAGKYWQELPENEDPPLDPDYVKSIGGSPSRVTFTDPVIPD